MNPSIKGRPLRVGIFGFFGIGNLGNEGSLKAFIQQLDHEHPGVRLLCFAVDAPAVTRDHGIQARQLMTYRAESGATGGMTLVRKMLGRLCDVPRMFWLVGKVDVLVVPGTGIFESRLMATPWGVPYWLFLAVLSCRLRGRGVALASVGAEPPSRRATRWLMSRSIRLATYVTYRDQESAAAARSMGARGTPGDVIPDLAFSLAPTSDESVIPGRIAIGVMTFLGGADDANRGDHVVEEYVANLVRLITQLCDLGRSVRLLVGDVADESVADRIESLVRAERPGLDRSQLSSAHVTDLNDVMAEAARAEVVLASRYHNLICALNAGRPAVSLGYAPKNRHLLETFGLGAYSQPMDSFDVCRTLADIEEAAQENPVDNIRLVLQSSRKALTAQVETLNHLLFEPSLNSRRARRRNRNR